DMYASGEYDLAGFVVGVAERGELLSSERVREGDALVAIASSGLHSNGYSLARRVLLQKMGLPLSARLPGAPEDGLSVGQELLVPTRIYSGEVRALRSALGEHLHALCHVTGGGLTGNLPRVLPDSLAASVDLGSYTRPVVFDVIARGGPVEEDEMRRTFNLGVGMVAVVAEPAAEAALRALAEQGANAWRLGSVVARGDGDGVRY